jgi:molybdopterin converting factor small subunit
MRQTMVIRVRFGSSLRPTTRIARRVVEIEAGATVSTLIARLARDEPTLARILSTSRAVLRGQAIPTNEQLLEVRR